MFSERLNILKFDDNRSRNAQKACFNEESSDSSNDFSANDLSTNKKMAQYVVSQVPIVPEEVFKQSLVIDRKISIQVTQN